MTTISAEIIQDSKSPDGDRITTFRLRYPRFIHAELLTHRVFSRNSSSSRAIPTRRLIRDVEEDPVVPFHHGRNQKGMQADTELDELTSAQVDDAWGRAMLNAIEIADELADLGAHKQLVNRVLEPFMHINTLVTATDWDNFFYLRCNVAAQPEIKELASQMWTKMSRSEPQKLRLDDWHAPFVDADTDVANPEEALKVSVARCARVSYTTHHGTLSTVEEDLTLYDRLYRERHASPFEHQATPDKSGVHCGNLTGFMQLRKSLGL